MASWYALQQRWLQVDVPPRVSPYGPWETISTYDHNLEGLKQAYQDLDLIRERNGGEINEALYQIVPGASGADVNLPRPASTTDQEPQAHKSVTNPNERTSIYYGEARDV